MLTCNQAEGAGPTITRCYAQIEYKLWWCRHGCTERRAAAEGQEREPHLGLPDTTNDERAKTRGLKTEDNVFIFAVSWSRARAGGLGVLSLGRGSPSKRTSLTHHKLGGGEEGPHILSAMEQPVRPLSSSLPGSDDLPQVLDQPSVDVEVGVACAMNVGVEPRDIDHVHVEH